MPALTKSRVLGIFGSHSSLSPIRLCVGFDTQLHLASTLKIGHLQYEHHVVADRLDNPVHLHLLAHIQCVKTVSDEEIPGITTNLHAFLSFGADGQSALEYRLANEQQRILNQICTEFNIEPVLRKTLPIEQGLLCLSISPDTKIFGIDGSKLATGDLITGDPYVVVVKINRVSFSYGGATTCNFVLDCHSMYRLSYEDNDDATFEREVALAETKGSEAEHEWLNKYEGLL
ncbi:hypothetical protein AAF712_016200 [Marasmius tenuissimus]|uniref:Uncharacterized protein n=1 Tax=Marasmius tenuissimus TaxID=585030 RepID=A0ABR2Z6C2_9AGAR|nr:hypothetical protein PM082_008813 [Marasmius tenuissimus]